MVKLLVFVCYFSGGQCEWLPWQDGLMTAQACEQAGKWAIIHHGGHYQDVSPPFDALKFKCE